MEAGNVRLANDLKIRVQSAFVSSLDTTLPWTIFLNEVYISQFCLKFSYRKSLATIVNR